MEEIDFQKQADEIGIDVKNLLDLYSLFVEQAENDIYQLAQYINEKNQQFIKDTAHHIKGACLNLELNSMVEIARKMQELSDSDDWNSLRNLLSDFKNKNIELKTLLLKVKNEH